MTEHPRDRLHKNTVPDTYVFDPREGMRVPRELVTIPIEKTRTEALHFLEGVKWTLDNLIGYKSKAPDVLLVATEYITKLYPPFEEPK